MIKQKIKHPYHFVKQLYKENKFRQYLRKKLKQRKVILVHQMGKVGSSSLVTSLEKLYLDTAVCHTHYLKEKSVDYFIKECKVKQAPIPEHLILGQEISRFMKVTSQDYSWKIITIVREPISRNISAFFQNIDQAKHSDLYTPNFSNKSKSGLIEKEKLINNFMEKYPHEIPLNWLDWEIKGVFGVDVFLWNFPREKGYQIIQLDNVELLILKLENFQNSIQPALSEFLGIHDFQLSNKNQAKQKTYFEVYSDFVNSIVLPQSYIDKMYNSKYMKHFYSHNEIEIFREKWSRE